MAKGKFAAHGKGLAGTTAAEESDLALPRKIAKGYHVYGRLCFGSHQGRPRGWRTSFMSL
jgi:hypothetical protein